MSDGSILDNTQKIYIYSVDNRETFTYFDANGHCNTLAVGGRVWRLPTESEIESLYRSRSEALKHIPGVSDVVGVRYWIKAGADRALGQAPTVTFSEIRFGGTMTMGTSSKYRVIAVSDLNPAK